MAKGYQGNENRIVRVYADEHNEAIELLGIVLDIPYQWAFALLIARLARECDKPLLDLAEEIVREQIERL